MFSHRMQLLQLDVFESGNEKYIQVSEEIILVLMFHTQCMQFFCYTMLF